MIRSLVFCVLVFGLAYTQAPLFYSNQNQYLLHGMARAGDGHLDHDWLANTADPTPIFSTLVAVTWRYLHPFCLHVYYILCLGLYAYVLWQLFTFLTNEQPGSVSGLCFLTIFTLLHAGLVRLISVRLLGKDYPWFFQAGVANQYVLGPGLQPSVAGVFLIGSLVAFVRDRPWLAICLASLAATLHTTYLLGAALLTLAYMLVTLRDRGFRQALLLGSLGLGLVLPVVTYNWLTFAPTSAEEFSEAQDILANFRIPHHTNVERWLDGIAWTQLGLVALAIVLCRGTRLSLILLVTSTFAILLTMVQLATDSATLALLFPWRISAVLVPVATTILLTHLVRALSPGLNRLNSKHPRTIQAFFGGTLAVLVLGGLAIEWFGLAYQMNRDELPLLAYVRDHARPGDVYLIPVSAPTTAAKGSASASFLPPPRMRQTSEHIAVDLQRFRLLTGTPIFVDFKSIPYKDVEVLEWRRRFERCRSWYERQDWRDLEGVTHVISPADRPLHHPTLVLIHDDAAYLVYRVKPK